MTILDTITAARAPGAAVSSVAAPEAFTASRGLLEEMTGFLSSTEAVGLGHGELEERLLVDGMALLRQLFQDHLDLRAARETRVVVSDAGGTSRAVVEPGHHRALATIFGMVQVTRLAYRARGETNLHPADAALNLPAELHSHGLRRLAAVEATRGSFQDARDAIVRVSGASLGKRQVEGLATTAAVDIDAFYSARRSTEAAETDVLVMSVDGKGVVMRPDALRKATAAAAKKATPKLKTRLSKGEKNGRKRMAEVGAVYDAEPAPRHPADIMGPKPDDWVAPPVPKATNKWLTASVVEDAATVVAEVFDEAERRDPDHARTWVALVDGNNHQIDRIATEATARGVEVHVVIDFVHVLEYLWKAAWSFHDEGAPAAETWVAAKALAVLEGKAATVAASIRRKATCLGLDRPGRANADTCADYLLAKQAYLDYPTALASGWPIATGVIEGACRHLVKDRMDITGARWGLAGAEAILTLRAVRCNGDFDDYWKFHTSRERQRVHEARYANGVIPAA